MPSTFPSQQEVNRALQALGIDTPYSLRIVGDRWEFHCLGGRVLGWPAEERAAGGCEPPANLYPFTARKLRAMARELGISRASAMTKAELIAAIQSHPSKGETNR